MNLGRVDHTAIAVRDLDEAINRYRRLLGVEPSSRTAVPDQGVEVAFLALGDTNLELICPVNPESGIGRFLQRHGEALHHIAIAVDDIEAALDRLRHDRVELIDTEPRRGVHGRVAFVHPRGTGGVLIELVQHGSF